MKFAYYKRLRLLLTPCSGTVDALMGLIKAVRHPNFCLLCLSVCKNRSILVLSRGDKFTDLSEQDSDPKTVRSNLCIGDKPRGLTSPDTNLYQGVL